METNSLNPKANGALDAGKQTARDIGQSADNLGNAAGRAADTMGGAAKKAGSQLGSAGRSEASNLKSDLDELISKIPSLSEADLSAAKQKLLDTYDSAKNSAAELASQAKEKVSRGMEVSGEYVKAKPLQSVGIAAVVGLLVGALISRR
jgi:ElaB/YqjD/DUF883 family membrane-anchored ribosome-binding protein